MKMAYKEEGKWWVSPANYLPEVTKNYHFPEHIEILDTTVSRSRVSSLPGKTRSPSQSVWTRPVCTALKRAAR